MRCNWGILGAGFIANRAVIPAIQELVSAHVLAVASRHEQRAQATSRQFAIERVYTDYQALLDDPDVDVVYIALPNHLHREWTMRAAQAGKHVLFTDCVLGRAKKLLYPPEDGRATLQVLDMLRKGNAVPHR